MSSIPAIASVESPDLFTLITQFLQNFAFNFNCHQVGVIKSFDAAKQTAQIQICVLRQVPDLDSQPPVFKSVPYPLLLDCPVFVPAGGSGYLTFPVTAGDSCLVLFNDRDIDIWFDTGGTALPNSQRAHDLSDGLALVGFRNKANALAAYSTTGAELAFAGGKLNINDKIALNAAALTLKTLLTDIKAALTALNAKTGPSAATEIAQVATDITNFCQ